MNSQLYWRSQNLMDEDFRPKSKRNFRSAKLSQPYQPLLLRILHGLTGLFAIAAIITAYWTYDVYDGRWGRIPLPKFTEIEGIL